MIRVLLVDEQAVVRQGLRMRLALEPDLELVGEAKSSEEALLLARTIAPDVVVMDVDMRGVDGFQAIRQIQDLLPKSAVIVLTMRGDKDSRARALRAGAQAFVEKQGGAELLLDEIRRLADSLTNE
jgi:DNA-binding NarL/FixJ family response regulator